MISQIHLFWTQLGDISTTDADDLRRRKLLNILLTGTFVLSLLVVISTGLIIAFNPNVLNQPGYSFIELVGIGLLASSAVIFAINRFWSGPVASVVFLLFLVLAFTFSDTPDQVANGRTLIVFSIPIVMSSMLLSSSASFILATLSSIDIAVLSLANGMVPNTPAIAGFYMLALISWLSSRSLENALKDLREINAELDQRVADRTRELSESLSREAAQANQRQAILQGIADGVVVFDVKGKAILANPAISRLLDIPIQNILNSDIGIITESPQLSPEDRKVLLQIMNISEATLAPMRVRWGPKTISVNAAPVRDAHGQAFGNVAVLRDFTREAEVEEMKNTFVAMVSHELRTPLNAVLGYAEMLRDAFYGPVNDKQANAADRILANSQRLLEIVSDLLDKAQIEAGRLKFQFAKFKVAELVDNLHDVMDRVANAKGLELTSEIAPDLPKQITSDAQRLLQVLINLVNNAVKFTEKGGISVRLFRLSEEEWGFDVTDSGPGIKPDAQAFIFDPFRQVDGTATRAHGGIGLGLSIVKRLVGLMGGRILLKSEVGKGSTFTVILPFEPPKQQQEQ